MDDVNLTLYEDRWSATLAAVRREAMSGEPDLSRFLYNIHRLTITKQPSGPALRKAFGLKPDELSLAMARVGKGFIADTVLDHADEVDAVIELGAGWGYNLFNLWVRGGPDVPYLAYELTSAGVETCQDIARRFPAAKVGASRYDFRSPTLLPVEGARHVLIFTAAAADKVLDLPEAAIEQIIDCAPRVTVFHFENIGAQLGGNLDKKRMRQMARMKMNQNLYPMLREFEDAGRLTIDEVRPEVLGGVLAMIRWSAGS